MKYGKREREHSQAFIREWNEAAHPFAWSTKSVAKIMAKCEPESQAPTEPSARAA
jgi:hypothetical protein